jgi:hypothetical protein
MTGLKRVIGQGLFGLAWILAGLAVVEWVAQLFERRLLFLQGYEPFRLLELAAVALLFVMAMQLGEGRRVGG